MSKAKLTLLILGAFILIGVLYINNQRVSKIPSSNNEIQTAPVIDSKEVPRLSVIASDLEVPWALVFMPDASLLFTERIGRVRFIDNRNNLSPTPVATIEDVLQIGEGGLLGITIHPNFAVNHFVYLYYTYANNNNQTLNRVARFKFEDNSLSQKTIIVDKIPGALFHNGGRIKFGPDGFLYITTGDSQNPSLSQDKNSLAGKILRVKDDGKPEVFSYGHRNPQGITWDASGRLFATEHGASTMDELNIINIGKNYGWPEIRGDQKRQGLETPILHSGSDTWAPAGAAYLNGSVFFAGLRGRALYEFSIISGNIKTHLKGEVGRIREVVVGPDNMLYITTSNRDGRGSPSSNDDKIIRVNPNKL